MATVKIISTQSGGAAEEIDHSFSTWGDLKSTLDRKGYETKNKSIGILEIDNIGPDGKGFRYQPIEEGQALHQGNLKVFITPTQMKGANQEQIEKVISELRKQLTSRFLQENNEIIAEVLREIADEIEDGKFSNSSNEDEEMLKLLRKTN